MSVCNARYLGLRYRLLSRQALTTHAWLTALFVFGYLTISFVPAYALTTITEGFTATNQIPLGSIVSLQNNSSDIVNTTDTTNVGDIVGVVINNADSLLSLDSGQSNQVQVATSGVVQVLVSSVNGGIAQGDEITGSPINGVGMKATSNTKVVGIAQASLTQSVGSTQTYTDKQGQKHSILIGEVPVLVDVTYFYKQPDKTIIPTAVQNIANTVAGKPVSPVPILICMGIFVITMIVVVSIIYSMIHSSIISVGRNPMSQAAIYRDLVQLSALVVGIIAVAVVAIYLILTRL